MSVETVLGKIDTTKLGITLTHEHLNLDFRHFYNSPPKQLEDKFDRGVSLNNVGFLRQYPYSSKQNLSFFGNDLEGAVLNDVIAYGKFGGGTIVENTTTGLERNVDLMKRASKASGVNIIAGTGYYIADLQKKETLNLKCEDMYDHMLQELTAGLLDDATVKAGFMGEIASVYPIKDFEKRAIRACAEVQAQTGAPVSFHPHRDIQAPFEIMRIFLEAGGNAEKAVMSHLDRTLNVEASKLEEFSDIGCYCQFDLFGTEVSLYQLAPKVDMPSDAQRIDLVKQLLAYGKRDRVLISHDIHTRHRLVDYGGHGYAHIINNVIPKMRIKGLSQEDIDQITIKNPACWLGIRK